jgi:exocyst complex component 2
MAQNTLMSRYKIDNPYPTEWPAAKDHEDSDEDEALLPNPRPVLRRTSKSRYSVLERNSRMTSVPGAERTKDGLENLVQRDEPDPLGRTTSVIQSLRRRAVEVDSDAKLSPSSITIPYLNPKSPVG